jgi:microcompartment protein CcmL/EutN
MQAGLAAAAPFLVDSLFLAYAHETLLPVLKGKQAVGDLDSLGVVETLTVAACLLAADAAVKTAPIRLIEMRLANQLGGKGFFTFTGDLADVQASTEAAVAAAGGNLFSQVVIPLPHADIHPAVL